MSSQVRFFSTQVTPNGDPQRAVDVEFKVTRTCKGLPLLGTTSHKMAVAGDWAKITLEGSLEGCILYEIESDVLLGEESFRAFLNGNLSTFIGLFNPQGITP